MNEVTKITFYGQDFSYLKDAKYSLDRSKTKTDVDEEHLKLLKAFCDSFAGDEAEEDEEAEEGERVKEDKKVKLRFPKNRELFYKYVGVFRKKEFPFENETYDVTLEIRCRFDTDKRAYFLGAMLLCQDPDKELKYINPEVNITFNHVMDIFLLFIFKNQLAEAAKKGIFRKYQRFENNDSRPHGTIDIARHIRENMGLKSGNIAYHYRELTANNPVNRLILAAYKRLCEKFPTLCERHISSEEGVYSTLKMLQTELGYSKTSVRNIVKENLRPVTHPYFSEYEDLRKTCLMILRDEDVSIFDAEDSSEETQSLYMDVTRLWEDFLKSRLKKKLEEGPYSGLSLESQVTRPIFPERDVTCRPDFVLWQGTQARAILDAKFKRRWDNFFCCRKEDADVDDDVNKCIRDMVVFHARRTGVIFPFREEKDKIDPYPETYHIDYQIGDSNTMFDMVRVRVPQVPEEDKERFETFEPWYEELNNAVNKALEAYLTIIATDV